MLPSGPVAVMSLTVSQIIKYIDKKAPKTNGPTLKIATSVAFCMWVHCPRRRSPPPWLDNGTHPYPRCGRFYDRLCDQYCRGSSSPSLMGITGFELGPLFHGVQNALLISSEINSTRARDLSCYYQYSQRSWKNEKGCCLWSCRTLHFVCYSHYM